MTHTTRAQHEHGKSTLPCFIVPTSRTTPGNTFRRFDLPQMFACVQTWVSAPTEGSLAQHKIPAPNCSRAPFPRTMPGYPLVVLRISGPSMTLALNLWFSKSSLQTQSSHSVTLAPCEADPTFPRPMLGYPWVTPIQYPIKGEHLSGTHKARRMSQLAQPSTHSCYPGGGVVCGL